jgi:hypothetical protein
MLWSAFAGNREVCRKLRFKEANTEAFRSKA